MRLSDLCQNGKLLRMAIRKTKLASKSRRTQLHIPLDAVISISTVTGVEERRSQNRRRGLSSLSKVIAPGNIQCDPAKKQISKRN